MEPGRKLTLFDSVSIIVGIIIGAGVYETAPMVAACMGASAATLAVWVAGGLLALAGALCYAELATAWPRAGGDYVYLTRALGRFSGFLFGWSQLAIVRPGDIALMAFIFARYFTQLLAPGTAAGLTPWAALLVVLLTGVNILGVNGGRWTQNVLTVAKVAGMIGIIVVASAGPVAPPNPPVAAADPAGGAFSLKLALILVLFTYGGWNEMAYVAAEVRNPERNILRALLLGVAAVVALYALLNGAFLHALGYPAMTQSKAVAVSTLEVSLPAAAGRLIAVLICISAAGAVNGLIFTGARISYALGAEHAAFRALGRWNPGRGTPVRALLVQGGLSLAIVVLAGSFLDTILYAAPVVWLFFTGTACSLFILRRREPQVPRPCRVPAYPAVPLLFLGCCLFMLYNSLTYAWAVKPVGLALLAGVLLLGVPVYLLSRTLEAREQRQAAKPLHTPSLAAPEDA